MMNASRASVFACPGYRSAMRRIDQSRQVGNVVSAGAGDGDRQGADRAQVDRRSPGPVCARPSRRTPHAASSRRSAVPCHRGGRRRDPARRRGVRLFPRRCRKTRRNSCPFSSPSSGQSGRRSSIDTRHPRYEETYRSFRWPCPYQRSIDATRFGDTTPRIIRETGARSHTEHGDRSPAERDHEDGNGHACRSGLEASACRSYNLCAGQRVRRPR